MLLLQHLTLMIANFTPVCYSSLMKHLMRISIVIVIVALAAYGAVMIREELFSFVTVGKLPFLPLVLPAPIAMAFWLGIIPGYFIFAKSISALFWHSMELIGERNQKIIDRRYRQAQKRRSVIQEQVAAAPVNGAKKPSQSARRRFLALPT